MKKLLLIIPMLCLLIVSCSKEDDGNNNNNNQAMCDNFDPTFSADVFPIISNACALSGCHVQGTGLGDYTTFARVKASAGSIKSRVVAKTMPPSNTSGQKVLTDAQIRAISCWVDNGAKDN